jgi:hypothetical protein
MVLPHGFFAALLLLLVPAFAQRVDDANKILYPDVTGLTFHYMDTVNVAFETDYSTPWMYIFCNLSNGALEGRKRRKTRTQVFSTLRGFSMLTIPQK